MSVTLSKYAQLAVLHGTEDWVSISEVAGFASYGGVTDLNDQLGIALLVVRELLDESLVEVGDLSAGYFVPWGAEVGDPLERISDSLAGEVNAAAGLDVWLRNTPDGDAAGRAARDTLDPALWRWDA